MSRSGSGLWNEWVRKNLLRIYEANVKSNRGKQGLQRRKNEVLVVREHFWVGKERYERIWWMSWSR